MVRKTLGGGEAMKFCSGGKRWGSIPNNAWARQTL